MHGLQTIVFLNNANREAKAFLNATDPGHNQQRRAEADLATALDGVVTALNTLTGGGVDEASELKAPSDFKITRHGSEFWVLPLTSFAQTAASRLTPPGTRRSGLFFILEGKDGQAIADTLASLNK